jgi:hypothetical protein
MERAMSTWSTVTVLASEAAGESHQNPWLFGLAALGVLVGLLIVTMMINVDR